jgi:hypothetical protein
MDPKRKSEEMAIVAAAPAKKARTEIVQVQSKDKALKIAVSHQKLKQKFRYNLQLICVGSSEDLKPVCAYYAT